MRANLRRGHFIKVFQENVHHYRLRKKFYDYKENLLSRSMQGFDKTEEDEISQKENILFQKILAGEDRDYKMSLGINYQNPAELKNKILFLDANYMNPNTKDKAFSQLNLVRDREFEKPLND